MKNKLHNLFSILFVLGFFVYVQTFNTNTEVIEMHPQFAADYSDDRILMGASHNVFVGKVTKQIGNAERGLGPETQYEVEITENIKGDLQGTVIVNQSGGYKDGVLYVMDDGSDHDENGKKQSNLLEPGSTYLLATRYSTKYNWYTLNAHENAVKLISDDQNKDKSQLTEILVTDQKVVSLKDAYKNEILIEADVVNNNTKNNYKFVQKGKVLEDKEVKEENSTHSEAISNEEIVEDENTE